MLAVAKPGFRAIGPDFRGYGLSEVPAEPEKTTFKDLVDDLLAILDSLEPQMVPSIEIKEILDLVDPSVPLPSRFSEEDLDKYAKPI